jgi:hypothetical protein
MTIRYGDVYKFETLAEFIERLGVSPRDLFQTVPESRQDQILKEYNDFAFSQSDGDWPHAESIDGLPDHVFEDWSEYIQGMADGDVIADYLRGDGEEYVHLRDVSTHTVVRLHPAD